MSTQQVLLARQPIYDRALEIAAYELLYRPIDLLVTGDISGDQATSEVIVHAFTELGLGIVTDGKRAFINFTEGWFKNPPPFNNNLIVMEILEDTEVTDSLVSSTLKLKEQGYAIALDDFVYEEKWEKILPHIDIVKVDLRKHTKKELIQTTKKLGRYHCELLAEKVETYEELLYCKGLGFTLFQGFFLSKPQNIEGKVIPTSKLVVMQLLQELQDPDSKMTDIEAWISRDPSLTYKILRIVNSPAYGIRNQIDSLQQAITILGLTQIQQWASIIALSQLSDKPNALVLTSMVRAKMCELIALRSQLKNAESYFILGLFSTLDAFMDRKLEDILDSLPLSEDLNDALLNHSGVNGIILHSVICHEQARWDGINWDELQPLKINAKVVEEAYLHSVDWAQKSFSEIIGSPSNEPSNKY
ncbi:MAG: hypothetical protein COB04_05040 [Gammaproteobacteria bacterium]|nr:MAG: hypothetical protein COB04_05040 [Gammaproteobacteria bacterium]